MSLLRWFFTDKCPNCQTRIASASKYCGNCGWGNEKSWRTCTSCGRSVGAESKFCWGCKADLRQQPHGQVVSDCWRREPGVAAIRITIETPEARLRHGIQVDADTRAVFLRNGVVATDSNGPIEIGAGYHTVTSFLQRLFGGGPTGNIEALIATIAPVEARIDAGPVSGIRTSDHFDAESALLLKLHIDDLALFQRAFMPRGKEVVLDDELGQLVSARVIEVLRRFASRQTSDTLLKDPDIRRAIEAELGRELPPLLAESGLKFQGVTDVRFSGEALENKWKHLTGRASRQLEAAEVELSHQMELAAKLGEFKREDVAQAEIDRISHERCLTRLERDHLIDLRREFMRRDQQIAKAHADGQVSSVRTDYELEEQRRREALEVERKRNQIRLEKEEDEQDIDTLKSLRKMQLETLASMKQIKVDSQVHLARGLHGLDPLAQIAGAGELLAPHMVAALRVQQPQAQPVYMTPSPQAATAPASNQALENIVPMYIPAVGLVLKQQADGEVQRIGTAWLAQGHGVLVTNAHVAAEVSQGGGWVVFPGTNGQSYPIANVELHPEYIRQVSAGDTSTTTAVLTHDVAIIRLSSLPPVAGIPIAPRFKLNSLRELQPVAYVGYPMRSQVGGGTSVDRPRPVAKCGTISSLTDWQQRETHNPSEARLIRHDLGVTGGASGSPLWDTSGGVIGIICGMNVERVFNPTTRKFEVIPSASLVNFAQRIDVLTDWQGW